eukprot:scaffold15132_cov93-Skeletonema_dohrnii-CCMP3373.AAC.1
MTPHFLHSSICSVGTAEESKSNVLHLNSSATPEAKLFIATTHLLHNVLIGRLRNAPAGSFEILRCEMIETQSPKDTYLFQGY